MLGEGCEEERCARVRRSGGWGQRRRLDGFPGFKIGHNSNTCEGDGMWAWGEADFVNLNDEGQPRLTILGWADLEAGGALRDSEIARCKKKITTLKTRLKDVEWKLRIVAALGVVGWIGFLYLLLHNTHSWRQQCGMHLMRK
ncbi:uncharacterized protein DS421_20g691090 [Arachis hypogaea]|nr:uncharacterized protein DS421_20g691090 [Arachis hypogaea]